MSAETPPGGDVPRCAATTRAGAPCPLRGRYRDPDGERRCHAHSQHELAIAKRERQAAEGRSAKAKEGRQKQARQGVSERRAGLTVVDGGRSGSRGRRAAAAAEELDDAPARAPTRLRTLTDCLDALERVFDDSYTATPADVLRSRIAAIQAAKLVITDDKYKDPNAKTPERRPVGFGVVTSIEEYRALLEANRHARAGAGFSDEDEDDGAD